MERRLEEAEGVEGRLEGGVVEGPKAGKETEDGFFNAMESIVMYI